MFLLLLGYIDECDLSGMAVLSWFSDGGRQSSVGRFRYEKH